MPAKCFEFPKAQDKSEVFSTTVILLSSYTPFWGSSRPVLFNQAVARESAIAAIRHDSKKFDFLIHTSLCTAIISLGFLSWFLPSIVFNIKEKAITERLLFYQRTLSRLIKLQRAFWSPLSPGRNLQRMLQLFWEKCPCFPDHVCVCVSF